MSDWAFDADGRLVDLSGPVEVITYGEPPPARWRQAIDCSATAGSRVCLMTPRGPVYDHRAAGELFEESGSWYVHVVTEAQWWSWLEQDPDTRTERPPRARCWPARHVWVEDRA